MDDYEAWYRKIYSEVGFIDEYYLIIDKEIQEHF